MNSAGGQRSHQASRAGIARVKQEEADLDYTYSRRPSGHIHTSGNFYPDPHPALYIGSPVTPPLSPYKGHSHTPQHHEQRHSRLSTPERHVRRESTVESSICPEWGPQCRDPEHVNALLTQALEDIEKLEAESDQRATRLLKANKKVKQLKADLEKKDQQIESLENKLKDWKIGQQKTPRSYWLGSNTFSEAVQASRNTSQQSGAQSVGLGIPNIKIADDVLGVRNATSKPTTGSLKWSSAPKSSDSVRMQKVMLENALTGFDMGTPSSSITSVYESVRSTPTIVRDCESVCSAQLKPPASPHFVGSPDWEPVFKLKECLSKSNYKDVQSKSTNDSTLDAIAQIQQQLARLAPLSEYLTTLVNKQSTAVMEVSREA